MGAVWCAARQQECAEAWPLYAERKRIRELVQQSRKPHLLIKKR
jgi:hypothetical protein